LPKTPPDGAMVVFSGDVNYMMMPGIQVAPRQGRVFLHQQKLAMLVIPVCLRKIPDGPLWLIVAPATQNSGTCVLIDIFVRPLPDVAYHVDGSKITGAIWVCIYIIRTAQGAALIRERHGVGLPGIAPRIRTAIRSLSCIRASQSLR
jgi:hypothetical protein